MRDGKIVGLHQPGNGRSCEKHPICGAELQADDLVRFRGSVVEVDGCVEQAIKVVRVKDGTELCVVGFLPRNITRRSGKQMIGRFSQIIELYQSSEDDYKRRKSHRNYGMASYRMLDDIPIQE